MFFANSTGPFGDGGRLPLQSLGEWSNFSRFLTGFAKTWQKLPVSLVHSLHNDMFFLARCV